MNNNETDISKFLSLVLRHKPDEIGLSLDQNGWADVADLLHKMNEKGMNIDRTFLDHLVATNPKKRFAFNDDFTKIRASQGHSIEIELGYTPQQPPEFLYHGTGVKSVDSILATGITKQNRQHVHLSKDLQTAQMVGQRHGKPYIFLVDSDKMASDNFKFFLSENGVWLTEEVPPKYLIKEGEY